MFLDRQEDATSLTLGDLVPAKEITSFLPIKRWFIRSDCSSTQNAKKVKNCAQET